MVIQEKFSHNSEIWVSRDPKFEYFLPVIIHLIPQLSITVLIIVLLINKFKIIHSCAFFYTLHGTPSSISVTNLFDLFFTINVGRCKEYFMGTTFSSCEVNHACRRYDEPRRETNDACGSSSPFDCLQCQ